MLRKGQGKPFDEFAWVILAGVGFVLLVTLLFSASAAKPILEPRTVDFDVERNSVHTFTLTVRSEEGRGLSNVTLTPVGEFANWITFSKNSFDVKNYTAVTVKVNVPKNAALKTYTGSIRSETQGGGSSTTLTITVANATTIQLQSRPIFIGSFDIRNVKGTKTIFSQNDFSVSKGLFTDTKGTFRVQMSEDDLNGTTDGYIEIFVNKSNQNGNLVVELNGVEMYNKNTVVGKAIVPFDRSLVNTTNTLTVRSTGPSPLLFWQTSDYTIDKTNFVIKYINVKESKGTFELSDAELSNFHHLVLQGRITEFSSPLQDLFVRINNQIVFAERPPIAFFNQNLTKDILDNKIIVGHNNTITFEFEKEAYLTLKDGFIVVYYS